MTTTTTTTTTLIAVGIDLGSLNSRVAFTEPATNNKTGYSIPNVVSNAQGARSTVALSMIDQGGGADNNTNGDNGENGAVTSSEEQVTFVFGEAARRTLNRNKKSLGPNLVRHHCSSEESDLNASAAAFFAHLVELTCDASGSRPDSVRIVVNVPMDASPNLVRGVMKAASMGWTQATTTTTAATSDGKKKKSKDATKSIPVSPVIGVLSDPAAVCVAHGLTGYGAPSNLLHVSFQTPPPPPQAPLDGDSSIFKWNWKNALVVDWGASGLTLSHVRRIGQPILSHSGQTKTASSSSSIMAIVRTVSDASCSGTSMLRSLVQHCASTFERRSRLPSGCVLESARAKARLESACADAVRTLCRASSVTVTVDGLYEGMDASVPVSRPRFDMLCGPTLRRAQELISSMTKSSSTDCDNILYDAVLTCGGVSLMPSASALVKKLFPDAWSGRPDVSPDEAVALGCAIEASMLLAPNNISLTMAPTMPPSLVVEEDNSNKHPVSCKVTLSPVPIGICQYNADSDSLLEPIKPCIYKGDPLPANVTITVDMFSPKQQENEDEEEDGSLAIVQIANNDVPKITDANILAKIKDIPKGPVELTMELTVNGKLTFAINGGEPITI